jgi:alkanesulfonate monooxygenase SsuD/methylene tetrahydromethanopterin reductase-like flavin-dependent oxidoreductase (luciferase family)
MKLGIGLPNTMAHETVRIGDGFIFGTAGIQMMAQYTPMIRQAAAANGKTNFTIAGLAYAAVGDNPTKALEEATHHVLRYYGQLWTEPEKLIHHGPGSVIAEAARGYAEAGLDILILFPQIPDLRQVEWLARDVLPSVPVRPTLGVPAERNSVSGPRTGAPRR